jgi:hypothetical protein
VEDLSLHILDIVENSIKAKASMIEIIIDEDIEDDLVTVEIKDNGQGIEKAAIKKVFDPFFTTRTTRRVGLGLPLLRQAAIESGGDIKIESKVGKGTRVKATFIYSHIDRKPLGNMEATLATLITGNREVEFLYKHKKDKLGYCFNTKNIVAGITGKSNEVVKAEKKIGRIRGLNSDNTDN